MSRKSSIKIIIIIFIAVCLTVGIVVGQTENTNCQNYDGNVNYASPSSSTALSNYYANCNGIISEIGIGVWEGYTAYPESYNFEEVSYSGEDCLYFGLPTDSSTYSMEVSLTSPLLSLNSIHDTYIIEFDYFSLTNRDLANKIIVYSSADGDIYEKVGVVSRAYNSNEGNFVSVGYEIDNTIKYIRIDVKAYYDNNTGKGVYLKNFDIVPSSNLNYALPSFSVNLNDTGILKYNGLNQLPEYTVTASVPAYPYNTQAIVLNTSYQLTESIEIGNYILLVAIYSADNVLVDITDFAFSIVKGDIEDIVIDYCATSDGIYINYINVVDSLGNVISDEAGVISYFLDSVQPYTITVEVAEGSKYNAFDSVTKALPLNADYLINTNNPTQVFAYDGTAKEIEYNAGLLNARVDYYQYNTLLASAPVNAGSYLAKIYIEETLVKTVEIIITPLEINAITANNTMINRCYDGTTNVYDYSVSDFNFTGVLAGDASINLSNLHFASSLGYTYLVFDKADFGGNYVLSESAVITRIYATITPVDIKLNDNTDTLGNKILTINDKQYDGEDTALINTADMISRYVLLDNAPLVFLGVPQNDSLTADSLSAKYDSVYAGENIPVSITITDLTCLDRFNPEIYTNGKVTGNIITKKLDINTALSEVVVNTKSYDGTVTAIINIGNLAFSGSIATADSAIMADNDNYTLTYTEAEFANANAGTNKTVEIKGFVLNCNNNQVCKVINSYEINDLTITGTIEKAYVSVSDNYFHIIKSGAIPDITTDPAGISLYSAVYDNEANAIQGGASGLIGDFDTSTDTGINYMRVAIALSEINYQIAGGYKIIVLEVTDNRKVQTLSFNINSDYEYTDIDGVYYIMATGGQFTPQATSTSGGYQTSLAITFEIGQSGYLMSYTQGVFTARNAGTVTITARQSGDANYQEATDITIRIIIVATTVSSNATTADTLYYGLNLPVLNGNAIFGTTVVTGAYSANLGTLLAGTHGYFYSFTPNRLFLGKYVNIPVELTAEKATLNIAISDFEKEYNADVNYLYYSTVTIVRGSDSNILKASDFASLGIVFSLNSATDIKLWIEGSYDVGYTDSSDNYLLAEDMSNYTINYTNSGFTITVIKSMLTIRLTDFSKFYGQDIPLDSEILANCGISGSYDATDLTEILSTISVNCNARKESTVGRYYVALSSGALPSGLQNKYSLTLIDGIMDIVKTPVTFTANNVSRVYGNDVSNGGFTAQGFYIAEDLVYYSGFITINQTVTTNSSIGYYVIALNNSITSDCYDFTLVNGTYTITPATLTGITFNSISLIYDGLAHSVYVTYDQSVWGTLEIVYSDQNIADVGNHTITAVIKKANYQDLTLTATLSITSLTLTSSGRTDIAVITLTDESAGGFDPEATLLLSVITDATKIAECTAYWANAGESEITLIGVYNYYLMLNGARTEAGGNAQVRLKLEGVNSDTELRIIALVNGTMTELTYTYENGYVVFNNNGATVFGIYTANAVYENNIVYIIFAIVIALVILIIIISILEGNRKHYKRFRERSSHRHQRWA